MAKKNIKYFLISTGFFSILFFIIIGPGCMQKQKAISEPGAGEAKVSARNRNTLSKTKSMLRMVLPAKRAMGPPHRRRRLRMKVA